MTTYTEKIQYRPNINDDFIILPGTKIKCPAKGVQYDCGSMLNHWFIDFPYIKTKFSNEACVLRIMVGHRKFPAQTLRRIFLPPAEIQGRAGALRVRNATHDICIIGAYLAPEPGGKKFVEVGQKIKKGQTIMIVEAMKTMNHVPSTQDGIVDKFLVKVGEPIEFGQPLISIK